MSVELEIRDGEPWWVSPDIWTVPGTDPEGDRGSPVEGRPCYLWARVRNRGESRVRNARVRFYWANPAVGFNRTTATAVGSANVSLDGGGVAEVLCLTPWIPSYVNGGHECVLAEIFHDPLDPLSDRTSFNVPEDRQVAQRNLSVIKVANSEFSFPFEIHNARGVVSNFILETQIDTDVDPVEVLELIGEDMVVPDEFEDIEVVGFARTLCPDEPQREEAWSTRKLEIQLEPGERTGLTVVGELNAEASLVHVVQKIDGNRSGGLSIVLLAE